MTLKFCHNLIKIERNRYKNYLNFCNIHSNKLNSYS